MPYVDPESVHNPSVNAVIPSSWGDAVDAAIRWIAEFAPSCIATRTTSLPVANNTWTTVTMPTEEKDIGGMHSTASNTSRLTCPAGGGGQYDVLGEATFAAAANGARIVRIMKNGTQVGGYVPLPDLLGFHDVSVPIVKSIDLLPGDYVELAVYQTSGGALSLTSARLTATWRRV